MIVAFGVSTEKKGSVAVAAVSADLTVTKAVGFYSHFESPDSKEGEGRVRTLRSGPFSVVVGPAWAMTWR